MAKSKAQGRKPKSKKEKATKDGGVNKAKAKAVKTNLKNINIKNKARTEEADEKFESLKNEVIGDVKKDELSKQSKSLPKTKDHAPVDMEEATEELKKLDA